MLNLSDWLNKFSVASRYDLYSLFFHLRRLVGDAQKLRTEGPMMRCRPFLSLNVEDDIQQQAELFCYCRSMAGQAEHTLNK